MELDFSQLEDTDDFLAVPPGRYAARVTEVREGWTRAGDPRWTLRLEVAAGDFAGKTAAWDFLSFGERGQRRARHVLAAFGFETGGRLEIEPEHLVGRMAEVEIVIEERHDPTSGIKQLRPKVPFEGYTRYPEPGDLDSGRVAAEESPPF